MRIIKPLSATKISTSSSIFPNNFEVSTTDFLGNVKSKLISLISDVNGMIYLPYLYESHAVAINVLFLLLILTPVKIGRVSLILVA